MAENIDTERERAAFGNYFCMTLSCNGSESQELIDACRAAAEDAWMERARRTPSASTGEDGLPELPKDMFCAWLHNGRVANAFTHGVGDRDIWDRDQYWSRKGYDRAPLYTADQMRQFARDAVAADRRARISADQWAALEAAREHLEAARLARETMQSRLGEESPQAAQGVKRWQDRVHEMDGPYKRLELACQEIEDLRALIAQDGKPIYQVFIGHEGWNDIAEDEISGFQRDGFKVRTLYAAPPLSSEQQAGKGEGACGS